ncbi:hypothetical protein PWA39_01340 [Mesomycoplasma ovipneumoniae ATCC 29419]|nr:hypothetical protein [Mesomycoplasma ovipneumoniae]WDV48915.1 hypothetical protein PWA39_01340 [Mesomycoplasma ovipneumoniae ATCC 29419]
MCQKVKKWLEIKRSQHKNANFVYYGTMLVIETKSQILFSY